MTGGACQHDLSALRFKIRRTRCIVLPLQELQLDLNFDASGELQARKSLHRLVGRLQDVDQALVRARLELLAAVLIFVDSAQDRDDLFVGGKRDCLLYTSDAADD